MEIFFPDFLKFRTVGSASALKLGPKKSENYKKKIIKNEKSLQMRCSLNTILSYAIIVLQKKILPVIKNVYIYLVLV